MPNRIAIGTAYDQALTPKILRMANSAIASRGNPIATVRDAVMRIGTGPIFSMAMAFGVLGDAPDGADGADGAGLDAGAGPQALPTRPTSPAEAA